MIGPMRRKKARLWTVVRGEDGLSSSMPLRKAQRLGKRHRERSERYFRRSSIPLYGLPPGWQGSRFLGGFHVSHNRGRDHVHALSLMHGSILDDKGPSLSVESSEPNSAGSGGGSLRAFAEAEWFASTEPATQHFVPPDLEDLSLSPSPTHAQSFVRIDRDSVVFDIVAQPDQWVGRASYKGLIITVESRGFPAEGMDLVRIEDIRPYIDGSRALLKKWENNSRGFDSK